MIRDSFGYRIESKPRGLVDDHEGDNLSLSNYFLIIEKIGTVSELKVDSSLRGPTFFVGMNYKQSILISEMLTRLNRLARDSVRGMIELLITFHDR